MNVRVLSIGALIVAAVLRPAEDEETWRRVEAAVGAMPGVARLLRVDRLQSSSPDAEIRHSALAAQKLERVSLRTPTGNREFYRMAASAHYEVEHTNPNHADVEICPICGRTGEYEGLRGNLVELVPDPLGLELLMNGTIRNQVVRFEDDQRDVAGITSVRDRLALQQQVFPAMTGDRNTLRIGVIVLGAPR